jgi:hypothetical protein
MWLEQRLSRVEFVWQDSFFSTASNGSPLLFLTEPIRAFVPTQLSGDIRVRARCLTGMLLLMTSRHISGQQGVTSLHGNVDVIDQLFTVYSTGTFKQIAATADDRHNVCQLVA